MTEKIADSSQHSPAPVPVEKRVGVYVSDSSADGIILRGSAEVRAAEAAKSGAVYGQARGAELTNLDSVETPSYAPGRASVPDAPQAAAVAPGRPAIEAAPRPLMIEGPK